MADYSLADSLAAYEAAHEYATACMNRDAIANAAMLELAAVEPDERHHCLPPPEVVERWRKFNSDAKAALRRMGE